MTELVQRTPPLQPGIHTIDAAAYHADPCEQPSLSASIAVTLCKESPLHAWAEHPRLNPAWQPSDSETFDIGTCAHGLLLEGGLDSVDVLDFPDWRTNAAKAARDESRANGRTPLLAKHWTAVEQMVVRANRKLDRCDADPRPFTDGQPEQTIIWEDPLGAVCRARLDWLRDDLAAIDDYKTAANGNPERWTRGPLYDNGYDIKAAFYLRGIEALTGVIPEWRWVVQEKTPPYDLCVVAPQPAVLALAAEKVEWAITRWRDCLTSGSWPGYPSRVCWAELPAWEEARWLDKEAREAA